METINPVSLIIYIGLIILAVYIYLRRSRDSFSQINLHDVTFSKIFTIMMPAAVIIIGAALRLYKLTVIPAGLHQDEASIGYEAYILSAFGVDRDGNHLPIYPITYGSGGGSPLMIYLNAATSFLFGSNVVTLRALPAVLGIATLIITFFLVRNLCNESIISTERSTSLQYVTGEYLWMPLVTLCVMAFCPWHIMLSRWSLDCNTTPFFVLLALFVFASAASRQKAATSFENISTLFSSTDRKKSRILSASDTGATLLFALSAVLYSLTLYSYGAATLVIPIHLIILCAICLKGRRMTAFQAVLGIILFIVVSAPLFVFYIINILDLPQIITPFFTITRFTAKRSVFASGVGMFLTVWQNFVVMLKNMSVGCSSEQILNYIPGFPPLFAFTFPMTFLGILISIIRTQKGEFIDSIMHSLFFPAFVFGLFVEEDITRMVLIFIPLVYYLARGFIFVVGEYVTIERLAGPGAKRYSAIVLKAVAPALFLAAAFLFCRTYFVQYNSISADGFMPGYGEACEYADKNTASESIIYSTYEHVSAPFMIALYYTKTPPADFLKTVHYKDPNAEFRIADSFTNFRFGIPDEVMSDAFSHIDAGDTLILHSSQLPLITDAPEYDNTRINIRSFGDFSVVTNVK